MWAARRYRAKVRVATWNIHALRGASATKLAGIRDALERHQVDAVALQEVRFGVVTDRLAAELAAAGLREVVAPAPPQSAARPKAYATVLASRWPMTAVRWPVATTWPQLLTAADVHADDRDFRLIGVHAPNGAGNGWEKAYLLEALAAGLSCDSRATVVAGDFNEPRSFTPTFASFRTTSSGVGGDFTDRFGVTHPRERWEAAVRRVLHPDNRRRSWAGQHAAVQAGVPFEPTHLVGGNSPRYFDHLMTTPDLPVRQVVYDHSVRSAETGVSDHSLVTIEIHV